MTNSLIIRLLGPLTIQQGDQVEHRFRSHRAVAVLAYLVTSQETMPRSELVDRFWPDKDEQQGRANLRWTLNYLNKIAPECWTANRHSVAFTPPKDIWVDIYELERALAEDDHARLTAVAAQADGEFLRGFFFDTAPEFEYWLVGQRERWRGRLAQGLEKLIAAHQGRGEYVPALTYARQLLDLDPWQESAHQQIMRLFAYKGDFNGALQQYARCQQILADELDLSPSVETKRLAQRIRTLRNRPRHNIPVAPTPLIGREAEMAQLREWLTGPGRQPPRRLVTITGLGGSGKTRLAQAVATSTAHQFLEGALYVPLANLAAPDQWPQAILEELVTAQWLSRPGGKADPLTFLQEKTADWEWLLVLDNCEQLIAGAGFLADLLSASPGLTILATSRERLRLRGEQLLPLDGLPFPPPVWSSTLPARYPAWQLFMQSAHRMRPDYRPGARDQNQISRICQLVEGLPLGLELAGALVGQQTPADIARALVENMEQVAGEEHDRPGRQRNLAAAFAHSWNLLPDHEKRVLAMLAYFQGTITVPAAIAVTGERTVLYDSLAGKALIRRAATGTEDQPRFDLHPLVRQFVLEKLETVLDLDDVAAAHGRYFAGFLAENQVSSHTFRNLQLDIDNFRQAWAWALATGREHEIGQMAKNVNLLFIYNGHYREGLTRFQNARQVLAKMPGRVALKADIDLFAGDFCWRLGDYAQANTLIRPLLPVYQQLEDEHNLAGAYGKLGIIAYYQSDFPAARDGWAAAADINRRAKRTASLIQNLQNLALVVPTIDEAQAILEETLALAQEIASKPSIARSQVLLGDLLRYRDQFAASRQLCQTALAYYEEAGLDPWGQALSLEHLSKTEIKQADYSSAETHLTQMMTLYEEVDNPRVDLMAAAMRGEIRVRRGDAEGALDLLLPAYAAAEMREEKEMQQVLGLVLGAAWFGLGNLANAHTAYQAAIVAVPHNNWFSTLRRLQAYAGLAQIARWEKEREAERAALACLLVETRRVRAWEVAADRLMKQARQHPHQATGRRIMRLAGRVQRLARL